MPLTLNQILDRIERLSLSHKQVNDFYFGDPHEFNANGDITYPAVFLESFPGVVDRVNKVQRYTFRMYVYDLVHVATDTEANELEVLSDTGGILDDILSMIANPVYQDDWILGDTFLKGFGTEKLDDMVAGAEGEFTIEVDFLTDSCVVPGDDVEFPQEIDMPRTKIYKYTAPGGGTNVISIPALDGKAILALWRAMAYKRAVAVAPTDSEKIQVGVTDLGSGNGILGNGSFILESGDALIANEQLDILYYGI